MARNHDRAAPELAADERRLVAQLLRGDRRAAEALVARTYEQVYATLFRMGGGRADLAADLTQETYRKAWTSLKSFHGRARFSTWLHRIAYNTYLNHIRRPVRVAPLEEAPAVAVRDPRPDQDELLHRSEVAARLRRAVVGLPEPLRFTVSARFWGELSVEEIARQEAVTGAAIRKRLAKAMGLLRTVIEEDEA